MIERLLSFLPDWLITWFRIYVTPFLKMQVRVIVRALLRGVLDTIVFITLPVTISAGSRAVWKARYHLTPEQQQQVERWATISQLVAYAEDVPPVVPLVLWYKEGGLRAENPPNCEGIMGLHTAVATGELPCFPEGPIDAWEVARQLRLGARVFKEHCPEVSYTTTDPELLKRCYLYYNAGPDSTLDPDASGYVMNGYDAAHQNMVLTDIHGRSYRLQALGAWPVHLAIQVQLAQRQPPSAPAIILAPLMLSQEVTDRIWLRIQGEEVTVAEGATTPAVPCREPVTRACFTAPHSGGDASLLPSVTPLLKLAQRGEPECGLLPGVALASSGPSVVLAPMSGHLTRYTDEFGHLAIRIENKEWMAWLTGLRSYAVTEGEVTIGQPIGAIGGAGSRTPIVHYALYDKVSKGYVDASAYVCTSQVQEE